MIPTVHLLSTVVNTYLTRNHISWPAFTTALKGFSYMQKNMFEEAEQWLQSAIRQYEESLGPKHLLTVETQLFYALCKQFTDGSGALKVLECAQERLDTMSYTTHFLSAKVSCQRALLSQQIGNKELEQEYILDTLRKIRIYGGTEHPWAAELMTNASVCDDGHVDVYRKLIERETKQARVFAVETEVAPLIQQWKEKTEKTNVL